ncbi:MAG: hypothetical protein Q9218_006431, partial [Villophora microphyllina]
MGGFTLDSTGTGNPILPAERERMRLTLKGISVALKVRPEILETLLVDDVLDKSKASPLAKAIVCCQALWFCLQCIGRLAQSIPVSLLELNTFAHALVTIVIYVQWWHKPLDIEKSTVVRGDLAREMLAWMSMYEPMNSIGIGRDSRVEARRIRTVDRHDPFAKSVSRARFDYIDGVQDANDVVLPSDPPSQKYVVLADCDELLSTGLCFYDEGVQATHGLSWFVILNSMGIERWKCAAKLFIENPPSGIWMEYEGLVTTHSSDWPPLLRRTAKVDLSVWLLFTVAGSLYGGLHALPWSSAFPSSIQKALWQAAVSSIVAFGPLVLLCSQVVVFAKFLARRYDQAKLERPDPLINKTRAHFAWPRKLSAMAERTVKLAMS